MGTINLAEGNFCEVIISAEDFALKKLLHRLKTFWMAYLTLGNSIGMFVEGSKSNVAMVASKITGL